MTFSKEEREALHAGFSLGIGLVLSIEFIGTLIYFALKGMK